MNKQTNLRERGHPGAPFNGALPGDALPSDALPSDAPHASARKNGSAMSRGDLRVGWVGRSFELS